MPVGLVPCGRADRIHAHLSAALLLLSLLALPSVSRAQAAPVRVAASDTAMRVLDPGDVASVAFSVVNPGHRPASAELRLELPSDWRGITGSGAVSLPPGGRDLRIASFGIPASARAGTYQVALAALTAEDGDAAGATTGGRARAGQRAHVAVHVRERRRLAVLAERMPAHVVAGERVEAVFTASNLGNTPVEIRALPRGGPGLEVHSDPRPFMLAPGESRAVRVDVHARVAELREGGGRNVHLRVETTSGSAGADSIVHASAAQAVTIVPPPARAGDIFHHLPTRLVLGGVGADGAVQDHGVTWSGAGPVGDGSRTSVEFLARWSHAGVSRFGERNEYRLNLRGPGYELLLGDQTYALSPLTLGGRVASGLGVSASRGAWTLGGFATRDRQPVVARGEQGAFLRVAGQGFGEGSLHLLDRDGPHAGRLWSARVQVTRTPKARADVEYGRGLGPLAGAEAWRATFSSSGRRFDFRLQALHADSAYPGDPAGRSERAVALSYRPSRLLRLTGRLNERETTPTAGWSLGDGTRHTTGALAVDVGGLAQVEYRTGTREGAILGGAYEAEERAAMIRLGGRTGALRLSGLIDAGVVTDRTSAEESPFGRLALDAALRLGRGASLSGQVERRVGRTMYAPFEQRATAASVVGEFEPVNGTRIGFTASGTDHDRRFRSGRLELSAEQALPAGHSLSTQLLLGTHVVAGSARSLLRLEYTLPFGAPLGHKHGVGRFAARVVDAELGRGIPGVVLRVGALTLVTDGDGRVGPVAVPAGTHVLSLERAGQALHHVPAEELPTAVRVDGGRTSTLGVALVRGAELVGSVRRWAAVGARTAGKDTRPQVDSGGVERLVVTLTRDGGAGETLRGTTDRQGRFAFDELRPGRWVVRVEGDLPPHHQLAQTTAEVVLVPGGLDSVAFRMLPRHRPVRIVAQAEVRAAPVPSVGHANASPGAGGWRHHRVTPTQRTLADVAREVYGDAELWPRLWLANRAVVADPSKLRPGTLLTVPPRARLTRAEESVVRP